MLLTAVKDLLICFVVQLIGGLADEKDRWKESVEKLESIINNYLGDVLVSAGYIAYLGPFTVRSSDFSVKSTSS